MDWSSLLAVAGQAAPQTAKAPQGSILDFLPMIIIIFGLFYILILRPQKKQQKQTEDMRTSIKKGDRVKTIGGIYGTVTGVDTTNEIVSVQVDRNVKIDFDRHAIATVIKKEDVKAARATGKQKQIAADPEVEETAAPAGK